MRKITYLHIVSTFLNLDKDQLMGINKHEFSDRKIATSDEEFDMVSLQVKFFNKTLLFNKKNYLFFVKFTQEEAVVKEGKAVYLLNQLIKELEEKKIVDWEVYVHDIEAFRDYIIKRKLQDYF